MPQASVKRLIECKKDQLIDLVLDIENIQSSYLFAWILMSMKKIKKAVSL